MKHNKAKKLLFQYCTGLIPRNKKEEFEAHLKQCSLCRSEAQHIGNQLTELKDNPPFQLEEEVFAKCREDVTAAYDQAWERLPAKPARPLKIRDIIPGPLAWLFQPATAIVLVLILSFLVYGAAVIKTERLIAFNLPFSLFMPMDAS